MPALCVSDVHPEKVCTKEGCFIAACSGSDFQDNVLLVVRVLRKEQDFELFFLGLDQLIEFADLHFRHFADLFVVLCQHLLSVSQVSLCLLVLLVLLDDRLHFAHLLDVLLPHRLIGDDIRIGH